MALSEQVKNIIGAYTPAINPDGSHVIGIAGVDFEYLVRAGILLLCLWSVGLVLTTIIKNLRR